jgi:hypothetical protein
LVPRGWPRREHRPENSPRGRELSEHPVENGHLSANQILHVRTVWLAQAADRYNVADLGQAEAQPPRLGDEAQ